MTKHGFFTFHIVDESPWPIYVSFGVFSIMILFIDFVYTFNLNYLKVFFMMMFLLLSLSGWFRDICYESTYSGEHTSVVQQGLKLGFVMFILSEVMFFLSFFWSLFYYSLTPMVNLGGWPPTGVLSVNPWGFPLLGTLLLMSSGISITWSHYSMMNGSKSNVMISLMFTILLGLIFTSIQGMEYYENSFSMSDSVYGSIFYMATGFHGLHVIVGTIFLSVCMLRIFGDELSKNHHMGFEFAIWYWHFVDVVWLFLYLCLYWWGW